MQTIRYTPADEQVLMTRMWSPALRDDPEAWVMFVFPWGQAFLAPTGAVRRGAREPGHGLALPLTGGPLPVQLVGVVGVGAGKA